MKPLRPRRWPGIVLQVLLPYTVISIVASVVSGSTPAPDMVALRWICDVVIALLCLLAVAMDEYYRRKQARDD